MRVATGLLDGVGAGLIMPAIVALVAGNVMVDERPRAYGLIDPPALDYIRQRFESPPRKRQS